MSVNIELKGAKELSQALRFFVDKDLKEAREKRIKESIILLQGEAKKEVPVDKGILRKSLQVEFGNEEGKLFTTTPYALYVHEGTKAHEITPKSWKALFWKGAEHPVKKVWHPWTQGNPFLTRALENKKGEILARLQHLILFSMETRLWW